MVCDEFKLCCLLIMLVIEMDCELGFWELVCCVGEECVKENWFGKGFNVWNVFIDE